MKYTINGFDQKLFHEYGLNLADSFLLRWFTDFRDTEKMAFHLIDNVPYYWIRYQAVIDDFPCLEINNTESIARRFNKFVDSGILKKHIKKNSNGTFSLFAIGDNYSKLLTHPTQKSNPPDAKVEPPPDAKVEPKDSSTNINTSTKINILAEPEPIHPNITTEVKQLFDKANINLTGKKLSWIGKEGEYARNIKLIIKASDNNLDEIRKRAKRLYDYVKTDEFYKKNGFTPSSLLSNWNKLAEINKYADRIDDPHADLPESVRQALKEMNERDKT